VCSRQSESGRKRISASEERGYVVGLTVFAGLLPPREAGFYGRITPLPAVEAPYSARPTAVVRPLPIVTNSKQRRHVIYRDSQGIRHQVVIDVACRFVDFRKLNARDTREVIEKALRTRMTPSGPEHDKPTIGANHVYLNHRRCHFDRHHLDGVRGSRIRALKNKIEELEAMIDE
jgi:hypothetical protein